MRVLISRMHYPVTVLGPGRRAGIWFQGCSIGCEGCMSRDTWRHDPRTALDVDHVLAWLDGLAPAEVDGVTISGGEPTEQPEALAALLDGIGAWRERCASPRTSAGSDEQDVLVYTGRAPSWLRGPGGGVFEGADAVVAGPFTRELAGHAALRGSDDQEIVPLTDLGRRRYTPAEGLPPRDGLQIEVANGAVWLIGIPRPGELAGVRAAAAERGVTLKGVSWT